MNIKPRLCVLSSATVFYSKKTHQLGKLVKFTSEFSFWQLLPNFIRCAILYEVSLEIFCFLKYTELYIYTSKLFNALIFKLTCLNIA